MRLLARASAFLLLLLAICVAVLWWWLLPARPDAFYDHAIDQSKPPGTLLKQEPFTRNLPNGTKGWRILYQTTRHTGEAAVASAIVVVPITATTPSPVIAWAHGTTGIARGCAPSLFEDPFPFIPAFPDIFQQGWAYVATDYVGMGTTGGHAYLIGDDAARNVLDSIRAAHQMNDVRLDPRTLVWGHSQGGHSALWSGIRAQDYAPDIKLVGVAALAPASDLTALMQEGKATTFGKIISSLVVDSYPAQYPDVTATALLNGWSRFWARDMARRCVGGLGSLFSVAETKFLPQQGLFVDGALTGAFAKRLLENTPTGAIQAPVFIGQGLADDLVFANVQADYVKARCAAGQPLDYRVYDKRDHLSLVAADSQLVPDLLAWSTERLKGDPASNTCSK
jgi:alpha-beta hydrolase superfamily lysophospholipase